MRSQLKRSWYITKKDLRTYSLKPPMISWGLMFPAVMVLAFYLRNPGDVAKVVPGLVGISLLFGATSMEVVVITFEKRTGALERLAMAPLSPAAILAGKVASGATFSFSLSLLVSLAALALVGPGSLSAPAVLSLLVTLALGAVVFALMGALLSVAMKEVFDAMTLANFFRFPMLFLSGVFMPLGEMPLVLRLLGYAFPLTYVVDSLRHSLARGEGAVLSLAISWVLLLAFAAAFYAISWRLLARQLEEPG